MRGILLTSIVIVFWMTACEWDFEQDPCRCIQVTASDCVKLGVFVVDSKGVLVKDLEFIATMPRTRDTLTFWQTEVSRGYYKYVDDRYVKFLLAEGDWIETKGYDRWGRLRLIQSFLVRPDECNCHVVKVFGPDTVKITN